MLHWLMLKCDTLEEWMFWRETYLALCEAWVPPPCIRMTKVEAQSVRLCQATWFVYGKRDTRGQSRLRGRRLTNAIAALERLEAKR